MGSAASNPASKSRSSRRQNGTDNQRQDSAVGPGSSHFSLDERDFRLHSLGNGDPLYHWTMWRMHLNEELSRVIMDQPAETGRNTMYSTTYSVTTPYLQHPGSASYGKSLKQSFGPARDCPTNRTIRSDGIRLPDNVYMVYGIPRVSLARPIPSDLNELHSSCQGDGGSANNQTYAVNQVSQLFDFISREDNSSCHIADSKSNTNVGDTKSPTRDERVKTLSKGGVIEEPLVSKSRKFWKSLARRKTEIIQLGEERKVASRHRPSESVNGQISLSEMIRNKQLMNQGAERQTNNLKFNQSYRPVDVRETSLQKDDRIRDKYNNDNSSKERNVKHLHVARRTSFLWGLLASKKREIAHLKKSSKSKEPMNKSVDIPDGRKPEVERNVPVKSSVSTNGNFESSFQRELAEKIRKRRERNGEHVLE